jgi:ATP-dependent RNA helicase DHX29
MLLGDVCLIPWILRVPVLSKNFLNPQTLANIEDLKNQLVVSMVDAGFLNLDEVEKTSCNGWF